MKTVRLNTVIFPPPHIEEEAIQLSEKAASFAPTSFVLDRSNYFTHCTLYSPEYPLYKIDEVISAVQTLSNTLEQQQMNFDALKPTQGGGVSADYISSQNLKKLRENVIQTLNPIRTNVVRKKYANFETDGVLNTDQKESVQLYGYPVDAYHFPHISISDFMEREISQKFLSEVNLTLSSFAADKIAVCEMGNHGTCTKVLEVFNLKT